MFTNNNRDEMKLFTSTIMSLARILFTWIASTHNIDYMKTSWR